MSLNKEQITAVIDRYIDHINNHKNGSSNVYWNAGITPTKENWGLTTEKCVGGNPDENAPDNEKCTSNEFAGGTQCYAFARFIAYLLTGVELYGISGGWTQVSNIDDYVFAPGDLVVSPGHTAIVWKVTDGGESGYEDDIVEVLEILTIASQGCIIRTGSFNHDYEGVATTVEDLRNVASYVIKCPPIDSAFYIPPEVLPEGTTPTPEPEEPEEIKVPVTFKKNTQSDGGPVIETREYVVGQKYGSFPSAGSRIGYTFDGWYTDEGKPSF